MTVIASRGRIRDIEEERKDKQREATIETRGGSGSKMENRLEQVLQGIVYQNIQGEMGQRKTKKESHKVKGSRLFLCSLLEQT